MGPIKTITALISFSLIVTLASCSPTPPKCPASCIMSLQELDIRILRARDYGSDITIEQRFNQDKQHHAFQTSYQSDGLKILSRLDIPKTQPPSTGYPVLIFAHGWLDRNETLNYDFGQTPNSIAAKIINTYTTAGYVVLSPGYRGHGKLNGIQADGVEYLDAWNNTSYLMPSFYAIDVLNLLDGLNTLNAVNWQSWNLPSNTKIDLSRIYLVGHSQGGDVALTALAVAGEGSSVKSSIAAASIWAGNIPSRFTQADTFPPMQKTLESFMSGDGTWTGSATGKDGSVNPNFIFAYPSDWIATVNTNSPEWTWQKHKWNKPSVLSVAKETYTEMYRVLNQQVASSKNAKLNIQLDNKGKVQIEHDKTVREQMDNIGGFYFPQYLKEPLHLHYGDRDFYSLPEWNIDLANRINKAGGNAIAHGYKANNHQLEASEHPWFSPAGTISGQATAFAKDIQLFTTEISQQAVHQTEQQPSQQP